jgi:hypothetical protein
MAGMQDPTDRTSWIWCSHVDGAISLVLEASPSFRREIKNADEFHFGERFQLSVL